MTSKASTPAEYLETLPEDRRDALSKVRAVIRKNLPKGFAETMQYGMITWVVPHKIYPAGYHCNPKDGVPFVSLASQKNYMSLYLMTPYMDPAEPEWLRESFAAHGKKLDMGKSCVRFKKLEDLPLPVIGELIAQRTVEEFLSLYEASKARGK